MYLLANVDKNNSMFDAEDRKNPTEDTKYGDNIYIQQIMALEKKATRKSKSSERGLFRSAREDEEES